MRRAVAFALLPVICLVAAVAHAQAPAKAPAQAPGQAPAKQQPAFELSRTVHKPWTGDFDGMIKRRVIRILAPYSKTFYFIDRGVQRGLVYDISQLLEQDINKKLKSGRLKVHVTIVPLARDEFIPALRDGRGDIAMGNLTITQERLKQVDFSDPTVTNVSEIVVTGPGAPPIATVQDLAGHEVFIRKSSSFYESIEKRNGELTKAGKAKVKIRPAPREPRNRGHPRDGGRRPYQGDHRGPLHRHILEADLPQDHLASGRRGALRR